PSAEFHARDGPGAAALCASFCRRARRRPTARTALAASHTPIASLDRRRQWCARFPASPWPCSAMPAATSYGETRRRDRSHETIYVHDRTGAATLLPRATRAAGTAAAGTPFF